MSIPTYFFARSPSTTADPLEGKFASKSPDGSVEEATTLRTLRGLYWFVEVPGYAVPTASRSGMHVLSTEEIAVVMDMGHAARAISGPFTTPEEAERSFEGYWTTVLGDDD